MKNKIKKSPFSFWILILFPKKTPYPEIFFFKKKCSTSPFLPLSFPVSQPPPPFPFSQTPFISRLLLSLFSNPTHFSPVPFPPPLLAPPSHPHHVPLILVFGYYHHHRAKALKYPNPNPKIPLFPRSPRPLQPSWKSSDTCKIFFGLNKGGRGKGEGRGWDPDQHLPSGGFILFFHGDSGLRCWGDRRVRRSEILDLLELCRCGKPVVWPQRYFP